MDALPPYQESAAASSDTQNGAVATSVRESTSNSPSVPEVDATGVIGGSGARLPLSEHERVDYDRRTCARLRTFGPYARRLFGLVADSSNRTEIFHPDVFYQSAASQLNVLLPALSPATLPTTTALRTITLRVNLPVPDSTWSSEFIRSGPVQGRAVLSKAYKSWMTTFANKRGDQAMYEMADAISGRLALEGFLILEEWWDFKRGLLMLVVRC